MNVQKTSDRINVVHCKDCRWLYIHDFVSGVCENRHGLNDTVSPNEYCSRGIKREQVQKRDD